METDSSVMHTAYLGLGSNLGDREATIGRAIEMIGEQAGTVEARSALFYSEPWGFESEHGFVNAVVRISTDLSPNRLLKATQRIERQLGKTACHATERPSSPSKTDPPLCPMVLPSGIAVTYHDRPIDIDILLFDSLTVDTPKLKIPHPLMQERDFVMIPLREILL